MKTHPTRRSPSPRLLPFMAVVAVASTATLPAHAELSPALDRVSIVVGAFQSDPEFNASVNTPYGKLQSGDINLGKETMPRIKVDVLLFDSQGLSLDYYQYKHGYTGSIANNSNVNGSALTTLGNANLDMQLDFAKLAYKWWFGSGNTVLGLGAGIGYYKISLHANATASVNGSTASISDGYSDDAYAPLIELGVRHAISPDLRLFADASGVKKSDGLLTGEIYSAAVGVEWFPVKNAGLVLDYGIHQMDLRRDDSISENFRVKFQGPSAFLKLRF